MKAGRFRRNRNSPFDFTFMKTFQNKNKIVKVSTVIRHVLFAGVVLWCIGIPVVLWQCFAHRPEITGWERLSLQASFLLVMVLQLAANYRLFRFFDRLRDGHLFDATTVSHLHAAGKWCVCLWFYEVYHSLIRSGIVPASVEETWNMSVLFAGLALIFFAWLLKEAQGLQEEQELTV